MRRAAQSTVLIVEDETDLRVLAESNISDFGCATLSAGNGREALALLKENENISVLFTDINLPDTASDAIGDGLELARCAVEFNHGLRVIYTTGDVPTDGMIALFVDGSIFLQKPYTRDQLKEAIERFTSERQGATASDELPSDGKTGAR